MKSRKTSWKGRTELVAETGNPQAIIVRFTRHAVRNKIYSNKKKLKGKKFLATERLTSQRYNLLKEAQEKYGLKNVWTSDDRILF